MVIQLIHRDTGRPEGAFAVVNTIDELGDLNLLVALTSPELEWVVVDEESPEAEAEG